MNTLKNELKANFSQIPNSLITDTSINSGALRVLLYLFTKPNGWKVYNLDICKRLEISEQTLTKYWKQLLNSGWIKRETSRNELGHLTGGYTYRIGNFTASIESTESVKSIDYSNNKPIKQKEINNKLLDEYLLEDKDITSNGIEIVKRFIDYRKKIKAPIKTIAPIKAYIKALRVLVNSGFNINEVIALQEEKEWRTINEEWVKKILLNENKKEKEWGN